MYLVLIDLNENPDRLLGQHFQGTIFEYAIVIIFFFEKLLFVRNSKKMEKTSFDAFLVRKVAKFHWWPFSNKLYGTVKSFGVVLASFELV